MNGSDQELLRALSLGDEEAFHALFDRHWKKLFSFIYRFTKDEDQTKDILQDVFLYIWNRKHLLYAEESFLPYLNKVAKSNIMMSFRKDKIKLNGIDILMERLSRLEETDDQLMLKETQHVVDQELHKMPHNMRLCFILSRYEEKSIHDIANELNLSEQTVKNNISEALRRLRSSLESASMAYALLLLFDLLNKNLTYV
ncbi:RNA polymerase sigma factor [Olivibacter sp. XZL3]|uniref:RNA polymerase sigma factor n=1 Tax=Olivibacter sp. XZL3 TaxID=1735116 RepID=UPI0014170EED|nr:sigma-70 family RNA polymerase sigma factor [Olivibacter sp. XZL3]